MGSSGKAMRTSVALLCALVLCGALVGAVREQQEVKELGDGSDIDTATGDTEVSDVSDVDTGSTATDSSAEEAKKAVRLAADKKLEYANAKIQGDKSKLDNDKKTEKVQETASQQHKNDALKDTQKAQGHANKLNTDKSDLQRKVSQMNTDQNLAKAALAKAKASASAAAKAKKNVQEEEEAAKVDASKTVKDQKQAAKDVKMQQVDQARIQKD